MVALNVSLPDDLNEWLVLGARAGGYSSPSDYVRDLVRRAQDQDADPALMRLRAALDAGRASGTSDRSLQDIVSDGIKKFRAG